MARSSPGHRRPTPSLAQNVPSAYPVDCAHGLETQPYESESADIDPGELDFTGSYGWPAYLHCSRDVTVTISPGTTSQRRLARSVMARSLPSNLRRAARSLTESAM